MSYKQNIGKYGQEVARKWLQARDYNFLAANFSTRHGELDLIFEKNKQIIFVEVKTRLSDKFGLPEEAVTEQKKAKMSEAGLKYLAANQIASDNYRFDIVAVEIDKANKKAKIRHHKGI
ncbi:MAG: YraN family protein [Patescibacteria group bacterium]